MDLECEKCHIDMTKKIKRTWKGTGKKVKVLNIGLAVNPAPGSKEKPIKLCRECHPRPKNKHGSRRPSGWKNLKK